MLGVKETQNEYAAADLLTTREKEERLGYFRLKLLTNACWTINMPRSERLTTTRRKCIIRYVLSGIHYPVNIRNISIKIHWLQKTRILRVR